jgi:arabinogalactan endo-1,4-beta-galactosidase
VTGVLAIARRCKEHNLKFVLDLHYSDWWADPAHQQKPTAWSSLSYQDLQTAVYDQHFLPQCGAQHV